MKRSLAALAAAPLLLALAGCGAVEEGAKSAASAAASQAASAAATEVRQQICKVVADGLVSATDQQLLGGLVAGAEAAGVPADITTPMRQIAESGDQVPVDSVDALKAACA